MAPGKSLDVDQIHRSLHSRTDRFGRIKFKQADMAEEFGVTKFTMSRTISSMITDGRIRLITKNRNNRGTFVITDPDEWDAVYDKDTNDV